MDVSQFRTSWMTKEPKREWVDMAFVRLGAAVVACALSAAWVSSALAHSEDKHAAPIGHEGSASDVTTTVEVTMTDNRYEPAEIVVGAGETVRFVVRNAGELVHEFNIGTREGHLAHREEMTKMIEMGVLEADRINHDKMGHGPDAMEHDDPNAVLLEPGESGEIIWTFPEEATLQFACNIPGHYEDGMVGEFRIEHGKAS